MTGMAKSMIILYSRGLLIKTIADAIKSKPYPEVTRI